jgi:hypothetical protein
VIDTWMRHEMTPRRQPAAARKLASSRR